MASRELAEKFAKRQLAYTAMILQQEIDKKKKAKYELRNG
jgi:hypothetical protein